MDMKIRRARRRSKRNSVSVCRTLSTGQRSDIILAI